MSSIKRCAVIGAGVIGAGWAARFLLNGLDVTVHDPHPEAERRTRATLANAMRARERLTLAPMAKLGELSFVGTSRKRCARRTSSRRTRPSARN